MHVLGSEESEKEIEGTKIRCRRVRTNEADYSQYLKLSTMLL
jgi:hypothetical protein